MVTSSLELENIVHTLKADLTMASVYPLRAYLKMYLYF